MGLYKSFLLQPEASSFCWVFIGNEEQLTILRIRVLHQFRQLLGHLCVSIPKLSPLSPCCSYSPSL